VIKITRIPKKKEEERPKSVEKKPEVDKK